MFVTSDSHEVRVASAMEEGGLRSWRAVSMSLPMRLFIPSWVFLDDGREVGERAFLMHERDFEGLLAKVGPADLRSLYYMKPAIGDAHSVEFREVRKIWSASGAYGDRTNHLAYEDEHGVRFVHAGALETSRFKHQIWPVY